MLKHPDRFFDRGWKIENFVAEEIVSGFGASEIEEIVDYVD
jgi:hypothetical protein